MPRTTIVKGQTTSVTTSETNLLDPGAITAGALTNGVPIGDVESYAIVVSVADVDITLKLYLAAGPTSALRAQADVTATVAAGASWSYQLSGNAMRMLALTGTTASGTATVKADLVGVVYS